MADESQDPSVSQAASQLADAVEDTFEQTAASARSGLEALLHKTASALNALGVSITISYNK